MLPAPPHWATSRPPGPEDRGEVAEQRVVVGDPVERRGREDRVDRRPAEGQRRAEVGDDVRRPGRRTGARRARGPRRPSPASRRAAMTRPRGRRSRSSSVTRPVPQPASRTVSSPAQRQPVEDDRAPAGHRVGDAVVGGGRPSRAARVAARHRQPTPADAGGARPARRAGRRRVVAARPARPQPDPVRDRAAHAAAPRTRSRPDGARRPRPPSRPRRAPAGASGARRVQRLDQGSLTPGRTGRSPGPTPPASRRTRPTRRRRSRADSSGWPIRLIALLIADASPAFETGTEPISVVVSGATTSEIPTPNSSDDGQDVDERRRRAAATSTGRPGASVPRLGVGRDPRQPEQAQRP